MWADVNWRILGAFGDGTKWFSLLRGLAQDASIGKWMAVYLFDTSLAFPLSPLTLIRERVCLVIDGLCILARCPSNKAGIPETSCPNCAQVLVGVFNVLHVVGKTRQMLRNVSGSLCVTT